MQKFFIFFLSFLLSFNSYAQKQKTALLLIDIQEFYFPGGFSELVNPIEAAQNAAKVLEHFRQSGQTVIHIQHKTEKQMEISNIVAPIDDEVIFVKSEINSFNKTGLKAYLDSLSIKTLVIAGMQTHMCVEAATRASYDFGYRVILVEDACATRDLIWMEQTIKAKEVHASTLNTLTNYATILTTKEFLNKQNN